MTDPNFVISRKLLQRVFSALFELAKQRDSPNDYELVDGGPDDDVAAAYVVSEVRYFDLGVQLDYNSVIKIIRRLHDLSLHPQVRLDAVSTPSFGTIVGETRSKQPAKRCGGKCGTEARREGGKLKEDDFDTIERVAKATPPMQWSPSKMLKSKLVESVKILPVKLEPAVSTADKILNTHQLIEHVEARTATLQFQMVYP
ncbi:hypothetical protein F444_08729 [Phytophthora nicotianae P1976]|uniref:Uncharacterized protein n=1 Tax=Phytophthora nicotianae P1976 TaxID=1317066 RepID=A0A081AA16_PHYNI|nr:hypothetical protein F444_08729 [Phytophthora nicotianae P1976]